MNEGYWRHNGAVSLDPNQEHFSAIMLEKPQKVFFFQWPGH